MTVPADARSDALAAMAARSQAATTATRPLPQETGTTIDGGGDVERLVVSDRFALIDDDGAWQYARQGDRVRVSSEVAQRGESLDALVDPDNPPEEPGTATSGDLSDDQLARLGAPELVAWVNAHPDQRARVRSLEEGRKRKEQRVTVLRTLDQLDAAYEAQDAQNAARDTDDVPYDQWTDEELAAEVQRRNEARDAQEALVFDSREQIVEDLTLDDEMRASGDE